MTDEISKTPHLVHVREADARGQAAMLLVESLIHGLIEKKVLSVAEAIEIVNVAAEIEAESGAELGGLPTTMPSSLDLLQNISASLRFDMEGQVLRPSPT